MPLRLRCPQCSKDIQVADELCGRKVRCPSCWETFLAVVKVPVAKAPAAKAPVAKAPAARPAASPAGKSSASRPAPRPAPRRAPAPPPRPRQAGNLVLIVGLAAGGAFLVLLLAVGGIALLLLWPKQPAAAAPAVALTPPAATQPVANTPAPAPQPAPQPTPAPASTTPPATTPQPQPPTDPRQFHLDDVRKSVVFIRHAAGGLATACGTGFFVTADGLVATNRHVILSDDERNAATAIFVGVPSAEDPDKLDYFKAQVAYCPPASETLDFALLKIAAKPGYQPFQPLTLAPAGTKMNLGDPVAAIGFPLVDPDHPDLSFNKGSISATRKEFEDHPYYQTDAAINHGNSGGPLVNGDGQVVGIVSRGEVDANNMSYALYMSETGLPGLLSQNRVARATPEAGPVDPKQVPSTGLPRTRLADWDSGHSQIINAPKEKKTEAFIAHNEGNSYWLTYKDALPENFELNLACAVLPILPDRSQMPQLPFGPPGGFGRPPGVPAGPTGRGRHERVVVNPAVCQSLYVRFGSDAVNDDVTAMGGTTVHLSMGELQAAENGNVVGSLRKGIPDESFVLTITRRGPEMTVALNGNVVMTQKLQRAQPGSHKFSVGGLQSALLLVGVSINPVDGPPVPAPLAEAPKPNNPVVAPPGPGNVAPPAPPPADAKVWAAKPPADYKGPEWTADPDKMKAPDGPPSGWLMGAEFKADDVSINPIGWITLRQGQANAAPGANAVVILREHTLAELDGKTIIITGKQQQFPPIFGNTTRTTAERQSKTQSLGDFTMKLEFGKLQDGKLPASIYLCLPDEGKTVIAGKFVLEKK